jgi:hypothetical protein
MKDKKTTVMFLILITGNIFFSCFKQPALADETNYFEEISPQIEQPTRAEQVMKAIAQGYSRQIEKVEFRNEDWALLLRDNWYYYAGGRMLPEDMLKDAEKYSPQPFYNYQAALPQWKEPTPEEAERFRNMSNSRNQNPPKRSPFFFDDLWRAHNRSEADQRVKSIRFLGKPVTVHYLILESLSLVEEEITAAGRADPQVQTWINNVSSLEGWMWRNIADTQSRSFHSYGLAVDIIPKSFGGKETYWLWASQNKQDWWNISYNNRYYPPEVVIKAFEKYGFVWGGKWLYFDTMHFEFRPEVLILGGIIPETRR